MKKTRVGLIKNLRYLCLIGVAALGLITIVATGGGGGGGGAPSSPPGTAPTITNVVIYDVYWIPSLSFDIGDYANFEVYATDPDLDMTTLFITQYHPADSNIPYYGPDTMSLPSVSTADTYFYTIDPIEVTGPAGSWRIEFQIEDSKGNDSNVFKVYVSVH
jgi:hypothetical protein